MYFDIKVRYAHCIKRKRQARCSAVSVCVLFIFNYVHQLHLGDNNESRRHSPSQDMSWTELGLFNLWVIYMNVINSGPYLTTSRLQLRRNIVIYTRSGATSFAALGQPCRLASSRLSKAASSFFGLTGLGMMSSQPAMRAASSSSLLALEKMTQVR